MVNARFFASASLSWTCTAVFHSWTTWTGWVPNRSSHVAAQS
ncbi:hypothetical protein [Kitasatospora griseola]